MERNTNQLQVEILSASNVLSNFSNANKMTSYLATKNISPSNFEFNQSTKNFYGSPKNMIKPHEENVKLRGYSVESPSVIKLQNKKENDNAYFLRSPLMSPTETQKNSASFNNYIHSIKAKKYELEPKNNIKLIETTKFEKSPTNHNKIMRNNSVNKLASPIPECQNSQSFKKIQQEIKNFTPKTFLMSTYNNGGAIVFSPKQAKMEKIYEKIKCFQTSAKKKDDVTANELTNYQEKNKINKYNYNNSDACTFQTKENFTTKVLNETSNVVKTANNPEIFNKGKTTFQNNNDYTPNNFAVLNVENENSDQNYLNKIFIKKKEKKQNEDALNKIYSDYTSNLLQNRVLTNNFMSKENNKTYENPKFKKINEEKNENFFEAKDLKENKDHEDTNEYKRLQEKLNLLEKKILSIKSNYDLTLKKNEKTQESKKPQPKKNDFVSNSCNFSENTNAKIDVVKPERDMEKITNSPQQLIPKPKKNSLEIKSHNIKYTNGSESKELETSKRAAIKKINQDENVSLKNYVTQVKPHNIFPNNVYEDLIPKTTNISENLNKNEGKKTFYNNRNESFGKASILKTINKFDIYYITSVIKSFFYNCKPSEPDIWKEHFHQTMQAVLFTKLLKIPDENVIETKKINLPQKEIYKNKKTLIFDLDETLIHCNENSEMESDVILPVKFPNGIVVQAGINLRPGIRECLRELSKYYELIVFTASHSCYANVVLDFLDPKREYIQHRLSRENCIVTKEGLYIKDLRILQNRDLKDVLIVDNAAYSFGFQIENGIPILPFYKDKNDNELKNLTNYLLILKDSNDIREINGEVFKMNKYCEFTDPFDLIKTLYGEYFKA